MIPCNYADWLVGGRPMIMGIFRTIGVPEFPARLDPFNVAIEIEADPIETGRDYEIEVRLVDSDGKILYARHFTLEFTRSTNFQTSYVYNVVRMHPEEAIIESPGVYRIDLVCDGEIIGESRIEIVPG